MSFLLFLSDYMKKTCNPIYDKNVVDYIFQYATPSIPRVVSRQTWPCSALRIFGYQDLIFTTSIARMSCYRKDGKPLFVAKEFQFRGSLGLTVRNVSTSKILRHEHLFVIDNSDHRIHVFDLKIDNHDTVSITFLRKFGEQGNNDGEFDCPTDVCILHDFVYVADSGNNRVQVFDLDGNFLRKWHVNVSIGFELVGHPTKDLIFVCCHTRVQVFSLDGTALYQFPDENFFEAKCFQSHLFASIAIFQNQLLCIADASNCCVHLFEMNGHYLSSYHHFEPYYGHSFSATCLDNTIYVFHPSKSTEVVAIELECMYSRRYVEQVKMQTSETHFTKAL